MKTVFLAFTIKNSSVAEFFISLANLLSEKNKVVIFTHANEKHPFRINDRIEILIWPSKRPTKIKDLLFFLRYIRKYKPRTIIANFAAVNICLLAGFLVRVKNRVAWYHTLTTQLDTNSVLKLRKRFFYSLASKIVTNSEAAKLDLTNSFNIPPNKIQVVNNAVRDPNLTEKPKARKIVYAGRLHTVKGVRVLVKALALVKDEFEDIKLIIIGEDESTGELENLRQLQKRLNLEKNIFFAGNQSRNYVLDQFSTAYFSVVPSYNEAFGYVVIESFSVHTPVIGSNTTGISSIIRNGKDGILFKTGDHKDLADKMKSLIRNPKMREQMAESCYQRFQQKYELIKVIKDLSQNPEIFN
ncbi:hypothetical protein C7S20_00200 [Christiangramia fulva]|uniref:Glycosyltransferase n=1 Tax=Christiangramia fulva TaxID=2126553 RepID=A0A2R3Z0Q8_9FLAO|nr:glycosyltransferase family 4 protein [Christiangramia fulva]AVR43818.1 hypothetical protein C7S20_00200 [Christiangramia fulva]